MSSSSGLKDWQKFAIGFAFAAGIAIWLLFQAAKDPTFQRYGPPEKSSGSPPFRIAVEETPNVDQ